jgi:hypothetical protein
LDENYDFNKLKFSKNNILIFMHYYIGYSVFTTNGLIDNFEIKYKDKINFNLYVSQYFKKDKLIGNIILKELTEKVFHPNRLLKICNQYNIEFDKLLEIY